MPPLKTFLDAHKFGSVLKEQVDPQVCITELVRCRNVHGKAFYAYIQIKPSEYMDYKLRLERGESVNPNDYDIIEYGWGEEPPLHVQEIMEAKYGVDHEFEKKVRELREKTENKVAG